jgi:hypothetical protein
LFAPHKEPNQYRTREQAQIRVLVYVRPDTAHEFLTWRRSLREFAPLLFRE